MIYFRLYFRFPWTKAPDMTTWCKVNATDYTFSSRNFLDAITGVWLNEDDAIMFRLRFGLDYEVKSIDN